jgi:hypothetical protein
MSRTDLRLAPRAPDPFTPYTDLAGKEDWHLRKATVKEPASHRAGEIEYEVPGKQTRVRLRDDPSSGLRYFMITGPQAEDTAALLRAAVACYTHEELLAWWDQGVATDDVDDRVDAILVLGTNAPPCPDERYTTRIRAALRDPDHDVRNAAVVAAAYTEWLDLLPDLERVADEDSDEAARARAAYVAGAWKRGTLTE